MTAEIVTFESLQDQVKRTSLETLQALIKDIENGDLVPGGIAIAILDGEGRTNVAWSRCMSAASLAGAIGMLQKRYLDTLDDESEE